MSHRRCTVRRHAGNRGEGERVVMEEEQIAQLRVVADMLKVAGSLLAEIVDQAEADYEPRRKVS